MGYRVGNQCFDQKQAAEDAFFSSVRPVIEGGVLVKPEKRGNDWYIGSVKQSVDFIQCSPADNFKAGFEFVSLLLPTVVVFLTASLVIRMMR